jgi:hypothetical protein
MLISLWGTLGRMSEQTPPTGQPTPAEGVGPTADDGATPPPPPAETRVDGDTPPPPPRSSSRKPWVIGVAVLVVLALVAGGVIAALTVFKKDEHSIAISKTAGGMKRDTAKEALLKQQLDAAEQQFKTQFKNVSYVKSGVYNQADSKRGPQGALVFLGAKVKSSDKNASTFVDTLRKQAGTNGFKVTSVSAGDGDAKAVCAAQASGQKIAICAWATKDSGGELIPTVPGWDSAKLAAIMRDLRKDVEKTQ